jgi:hypothetical protein
VEKNETYIWVTNTVTSFLKEKEERKMKKIQILGTGCAKCMKLTANAEEAAKQAGIEF